MNILVFFVFFISFARADQLKDYCDQNKGVILKKYRCPKSRLNLPIRTCEFENSYGDLQFVNGCSGPTGGHKETFFKACIKHDLCYHHEPSTGGLNRKDCDQLFLEIALKSCKEESQDKKSCRFWANTMYKALRIVGTAAFACSDRPATY
jgi:hypothetical protein